MEAETLIGLSHWVMRPTQKTKVFLKTSHIGLSCEEEPKWSDNFHTFTNTLIRTTTSVNYFCLLSVQKQAYGKYVYIRLIGKKSSFMIVYEDWLLCLQSSAPSYYYFSFLRFFRCFERVKTQALSHLSCSKLFSSKNQFCNFIVLSQFKNNQSQYSITPMSTRVLNHEYRGK